MDPASPSALSATTSLLGNPSVPLDPLAVGTALALLVLSLIVSAFASGAEVAFFSLDEPTTDPRGRADDPRGERVAALLASPRRLLVTLLLLNTLANVTAAVMAAVLTAGAAARFGWSPKGSLAAQVVMLTFVLLVVAEMLPRMLASRNAANFSLRASGPLLVAHRVFGPLSAGLTGLMERLRGRFGARPAHLSTDDLKAMADVGQAQGALAQRDRELIYSIVEFHETTVREIMVSRLDIVALPVTASVQDAISLIRESGHSRVPLYIEHLDNILGILYAKDLIRFLAAPRPPARVDWTRLARPAMFVPLGKKLDDLLRDFQTRRTHIAIVVDEYGGTAGIVTLENVLEEIVGDIQDEYDVDEQAPYAVLGPGLYRFDARINLDDMFEVLGLDLDTEEYDFETLGGLIFHLTGSIPQVGAEIVFGPLHLRVERVENHRIGEVEVRVTPEEVIRDDAGARRG